VCPFACANQEKKKSGILHFFYFSQVKEKLGNLCVFSGTGKEIAGKGVATKMVSEG
jgi:hypothetical protein